MTDIGTALEVAFLNDTNVYFLPILEGGLAVRHVALHVRRLFKIEHDIVLCKPRTRLPLPGGLLLLPGRAVTVCPTTAYRKVIVSACRQDEGFDDDATAPALLHAAAADTTYVAPVITVCVDAIVCPHLNRGVAAYCVYEPLRTASRDAILAPKTNDVQVCEYSDGRASRNAAECELRALADALCYADKHVHCGPDTRIDVLTESTYCIHVVRALQKHEANTGETPNTATLQIQTVMNRHAVRVQWPYASTAELGRPTMTALRRVAIATHRTRTTLPSNPKW